MHITYIPMARGFVYLACVVDWFTRRVLSWRLSITLGVNFCIEAVEKALARHGKPDIFNTDQGSQFTSIAFIQVLKDAKIAISMDGKSAWRDNVFVKRLWRTIKYEEERWPRLSVQPNPIYKWIPCQLGRDALRQFIKVNAVRCHPVKS